MEKNGRGVIKNRNRSTQVKDYSDLRFGNITPTDIDGLIDFGDKAFVFIELKYRDNSLPYGQKLAIERLVDSIQESGRQCIGIVARHECPPDEDILVGRLPVDEIRRLGKWRPTKYPMTVRELIESFLSVNNISQ